MAVVATATVAQDIFSKLRTLIIANKPTYTYDGVEYTYTLESEYPRTNPSFPIVVLNESDIDIALLNLDGSGEDYGAEIQLDFYAKELHGKKSIDAGRDALRAAFLGNISAFDTDDGLLPQEDFWVDSSSDAFSEKNQVVNTGSSIIKFKLK